MLRHKLDKAEEIGAAALMEELFSPEALANLSPSAAALPSDLWAEALRDPVMELLLRPGKGFRRRLVETAFRLAGGQGTTPPLAGAVLEVIHAGSMVVDDIEDGSSDRRGAPTVHLLHGLPRALNAGNWMYFAPLALLGELGLQPAAELELSRRASRTLLDCHYGQALDLTARPEKLPQPLLLDAVRTITCLKSGRLLGLGAELGAICAGADHRVQKALGDFGEALGVGLQMLDDLGNLWGKVAPQRRHEDLRQGRLTWAWAWAAGLLDEAAFAELVAEGVAVRERAEDAAADGDTPPRCEALAAILRGLVGSHGRLYAHWHLMDALARLRAQLPAGRGAALHALELEITRLEASYG